MKRIGILGVILSTLLSAQIFAVSAFSDVPNNKWYTDAVMYCAENGYVSGYSDGSFKPNNTITRAELAAVMNKMLGLNSAANNTFKDVSNGKWYTTAVLNCVQTGIITGYSSTQYGPNDKVTREQAAVILAKSFNISKTNGRTSFSDDGKISSWAVGSVKAMSAKGLIAGVGNNRFAPKDNITRAAVCTILRHAEMGESEPTSEFDLVCERYRAASDLYFHVLLVQDWLDQEDKFIMERTNYEERYYYHVPQADTKQEFINYCRQYYTPELVNELIGMHKFIEKNGKLYMDQSWGLGGPIITEVEMTVRKDSDSRYTIGLYEFYDYDRVMNTSTEVHLIKVNGYWVWDSIIGAADDVKFYQINS